MKKRQSVPEFNSEAEEAQWWYHNRELSAKLVEAAVAEGRATTLAQILERGRKNAGPTPTVSIRIDPADLTRARLFAQRKGLCYQTYLKMLLHEALEKEGMRVRTLFLTLPAAAAPTLPSASRARRASRAEVT